MPPKVVEKLLDIEGAAEMLGRTPYGIRRLVECKMIPHRKHGRRGVFLESELQALIAGLPGPTLDEVAAREK